MLENARLWAAPGTVALLSRAGSAWGIGSTTATRNTLPKTPLNNKAGSTNTLTVLGQEAQAAAAHFGITDLNDANNVIV